MAITYKSTVYTCAVQGVWVTVLLRCWVFMSALNGQRTNIMKFEASRGDDYRNNCSCKLTTMSRFVAIQSFSSVFCTVIQFCVYIVCCQILLEVLRTLDSQNLSHASTNISCHQQDMKDPERDNTEWKERVKLCKSSIIDL